MSFPVTIFVEGDSDKTFVSQFIKARFDINVPGNGVLAVGGGCDRLRFFVEQFQISQDLGLQNLVIFDADESFQRAQQSLKDQMRSLKITFDPFLFPNDRDPGELEDLLERIAPAANRFIFSCFEQYLTCLGDQQAEGLNLPAKKTKIFAYTDLLGETTKSHQRNYLDTRL